MKRVLTIAGSDSGGGAGIQADLKTFVAFGVYGMSVITAVTAQDTQRVHRSLELPLDLIETQLDAVVTDIGVDAAKTGMLSGRAVVELVAQRVRELGVPNLVVDPVMVAKSGDALLAEEARASLRDHLLPLATVVTPNLHEAQALTGEEIHSLEDMRRVARRIHEMGPQWVVLKGGHLSGEQEAIDVAFNGKDYFELKAPRFQTPNTHGTGCAFSAAIAAGLAKGHSPPEAIRRAKAYITEAIRTSLPFGQGHGPINHLAGLRNFW